MMPKIPLIEDLTKAPIPTGSNILVEFDPASDWYNASLTILAGWLGTGGRAAYNVADQPTRNIRMQLSRLGIDAESLEKNDGLQIYDWYSSTLAQKSKERFKEDSLKVSDLSVAFLKESKELTEPIRESSTGMMIVDDASTLDRFNEEKAWVEFVLTRLIAREPLRPRQIAVIGLIKGLHSERVYRRLEAAFDGIIDLKLDETTEETRNIIRLRNMRNVVFDSRWHRLKINENFEVLLEK